VVFRQASDFLKLWNAEQQVFTPLPEQHTHVFVTTDRHGARISVQAGVAGLDGTAELHLDPEPAAVTWAAAEHPVFIDALDYPACTLSALEVIHAHSAAP
jgi:hypothetical protein